jgi:hypothetical protein
MKIIDATGQPVELSCHGFEAVHHFVAPDFQAAPVGDVSSRFYIHDQFS